MSSSAGAPTQTRPPGGPSRAVMVGVIAVVISGMVGAWSGATAAQPLVDAGAVIRWSVLLLKPVADVAMAAALGFAGLGAFVLSDTEKTARVWRAGRLAAVSASVWALAEFILSYLSYGDIAGTHLGASGYTTQWWTSTWQLEILRNVILTAIGAALMAVGCWWSSSRNVLAWMTALGVVSLWPRALSGHAAGSTDHETAVDSLIMHIVPVSLWVGGLIALGVMWPRLGKARVSAVQRYSTVATWCIGFVGFSGILASSLRVDELSQYVTTRYGLIMVAKAACLIVLGFFGLRQRQRVVGVLKNTPSDVASRGVFARLAAIELVVMGSAMGLAAALARSAPPSAQVIESANRAVSLTGYPAPPHLTTAQFFSQWRIEWLMTTFAILAVGVYMRWVIRLHRRGDAWPIHRSVVWVLAWVIFLITVDGGAGVYGRVMMSVHMAEHMVISMTVPVLLVLGAPVTLMLRALPKRHDGTRGPREVLLSSVHSRYVNILANPAVSGAVFFISLVLFYYTPLFGLALRTHTGHMLMYIHFVLSGYLFAWALIGIDPGPKKWPAPLRLLVLLITITFHAFFGVAMMTGDSLLGSGFYTQLGYVTDPLRDQQSAGTITWGSGEGPTFLLAMIVASQWYRTDRIEGERAERQAERDGDAELRAYNDFLAARSGRSGDGEIPGDVSSQRSAGETSGAGEASATVEESEPVDKTPKSDA